jgi:hypothetical protein
MNLKRWQRLVWVKWRTWSYVCGREHLGEVLRILQRLVVQFPGRWRVVREATWRCNGCGRRFCYHEPGCILATAEYWCGLCGPDLIEAAKAAGATSHVEWTDARDDSQEAT